MHMTLPNEFWKLKSSQTDFRLEFVMPHHEILTSRITAHALIDTTSVMGDLYFGVEWTAQPLKDP
jgi:hypothetical protein